MKAKKTKKLSLTKKRKLSMLRYPMREAILAEMASRQWTAYRLAKEVQGKVKPQSVYNYVAGRTDMRGDLISELLKALSLEVAPAK